MSDITEPIGAEGAEAMQPYGYTFDPTTTRLEAVSAMLGFALQAQYEELDEDAESALHEVMSADVCARLFESLRNVVGAAVQAATEQWEADIPTRFAREGAMRRIANEWHSGQGSAMCSFATTGAIRSELLDEIKEETMHADVDVHGEEAIDELCDLLQHVRECGERNVQPGWSELWG